MGGRPGEVAAASLQNTGNEAEIPCLHFFALTAAYAAIALMLNRASPPGPWTGDTYPRDWPLIAQKSAERLSSLAA